jgi:uncharacterized protein
MIQIEKEGTESNVDALLKDVDYEKISSMLERIKEIKNILYHLGKAEDVLKNKIKIYLKERNWENYDDKDSKVSVRFTSLKRESVNKDYLNSILNDAQKSEAFVVKTYERMDVVTPKVRERLKQYVQKKN